MEQPTHTKSKPVPQTVRELQGITLTVSQPGAELLNGQKFPGQSLGRSRGIPVLPRTPRSRTPTPSPGFNTSGAEGAV